MVNSLWHKDGHHSLLRCIFVWLNNLHPENIEHVTHLYQAKEVFI